MMLKRFMKHKALKHMQTGSMQPEGVQQNDDLALCFCSLDLQQQRGARNRPYKSIRPRACKLFLLDAMRHAYMGRARARACAAHRRTISNRFVIIVFPAAEQRTQPLEQPLSITCLPSALWPCQGSNGAASAAPTTFWGAMRM